MSIFTCPERGAAPVPVLVGVLVTAAAPVEEPPALVVELPAPAPVEEPVLVAEPPPQPASSTAAATTTATRAGGMIERGRTTTHSPFPPF